MQANDSNTFIDEYAIRIIRHKAKSLIGKKGLTKSDLEDIEHDLIVDLLQRLPKYDSDKATRNTFISRLVERKISNILRYRMAERRDCRREEGSLDFEIEMEETGKVFIRTNLVDADEYEIRIGRRNRSRQEENELRLDVESIIAGLPPHLRHICERLKSMSKADAERELGMAHSTFHDQVIRPLREAFAKAGLGDDR